MPFLRIQNADDPRLSAYGNLPGSNSSHAASRFVAEGRVLVQRLLASSLVTESILCSERYRDEFQQIGTDLPVYLVPHEVIDEVVGFKFHRGVLACGHRPRNPLLHQLFGESSNPKLIAVGPHIADPTNLGGVLRNCSAFGVDGMLLGPQCADVYSRRVVRVSMGTALQIPIRVADNLSEEMRQLSECHGYHRVATVLDTTATPLQCAQLRPRIALLFGSEGHGLDEKWIQQCDERVTLPMQRNTDSLNLATATGIILYHYTHVASPVSE